VPFPLPLKPVEDLLFDGDLIRMLGTNLSKCLNAKVDCFRPSLFEFVQPNCVLIVVWMIFLFDILLGFPTKATIPREFGGPNPTKIWLLGSSMARTPQKVPGNKFNFSIGRV
jgi:hypothetical protein